MQVKDIQVKCSSTLQNTDSTQSDTSESSGKPIQKSSYLNQLLDACVLDARKYLVSVLSNVILAGCRFFASFLVDTRNEGVGQGKKSPLWESVQ